MSVKKLDLSRSGLEDHTLVGKELKTPFQKISTSTEQIFWLRDLLPEFLWIDALVLEYGGPLASRVFNDFLTEADHFNSHPKEILDGTVGAFRLIAPGERQAFVAKMASKIDRAVARPLRHVLTLYTDCPMAWMVDRAPMERNSAVSLVRDAITRLGAGKDPYAGFCRALPLNRLFAHDKVFISSELKETIEAIRNYPNGDRYRAETFARTIHNTTLMNRAKEDPDTFAWARSFWKANRSIVPCLL